MAMVVQKIAEVVVRQIQIVPVATTGMETEFVIGSAWHRHKTTSVLILKIAVTSVPHLCANKPTTRSRKRFHTFVKTAYTIYAQT